LIFAGAVSRNVNANKTECAGYRKQSHVHTPEIIGVHVQMNVYHLRVFSSERKHKSAPRLGGGEANRRPGWAGLPPPAVPHCRGPQARAGL